MQFCPNSALTPRKPLPQRVFAVSEKEQRAGIFIGSEFSTVSCPDLVAATREAGDAGFDVLITCAFSFDAHSADFTKLGRILGLNPAKSNPAEPTASPVGLSIPTTTKKAS